MKTILCKYRVFAVALTVFFLFVTMIAGAVDRYSVATGNWSATTTWSATSGGASGASVPVAGDNVFIEGGFTVSITANAACANLTIGTATAGTLQFSNTTPRTLTVTGNISVNNGTFTTADVGGANVHSLLLGGNLSVTAGNTLQFINGNDAVNTTFNGTTNQTVSGAGTTMNFNLITINNTGAGGSDVVEVSSTNFTVPAGFLTLTDGIFKVSGSFVLSNTFFATAGYTIPAIAGIWLNNANATVTAQGSDVTLNGSLQVTAGTYNVGNADDVELRYGNGSSLTVDGGTLNIAAAFNGTAAANTISFTMSSGTILLSTFDHTIVAGRENFEISAAGSSFTMSGGTIIIQRVSTDAGTNEWDMRAGTVSISGGTLQFGNVSTPAASVFEITTASITPSVVISSTNSPTLSLNGTTTFDGSVTISTGATLIVNNNNITVSGSWSNSGTFTAGTGTVDFNTASSHTLAGSSTTTFNNLTISAGTLDAATNNKDIIVGGNWTNNGTFTAGTATVTFNRATAQTIGGTSTTTFNNVAMSGAGSKTFEANTNLTNTMTFSSGPATIDFNGAANNKVFTFKSSASNTARVANVNGFTLLGDVISERFIPQRAGLGRAYRFLTSTVNTSTNMRTNWMEGGLVTTVGGFSDPVPGYGTHITGSGGNANNFDVTQTNQSSIYTATNGGTSATLVYTPVANASGTLSATQGYFVYVRGNRSESINIPNVAGASTSATTLRTTGTLLTGTQTSFGVMVGGAGALNVVTNPYESPIDWSLVQPACTGVTTSYTLWDPNFGTRGGFVTVNTAGVASSGAATKFIQPGQAFFVEASGASAPTVSIQETHKAAGNNNGVFRPGSLSESFRTELYFTEQPSGYRRIADGVIALYDNSYSAGIDVNDASEINNWDENIAIARSGKHLAIESRPVIITRDTLPLFMNNMRQMAYEFEFTPSSFTNTGLKAELIDNFLGTRTILSVTATTVVSFTVTSDPASSASDRFMVVFGPQAALAIDLITIRANKVNNGVQVDWTSRTETDMSRYEVERSANGTNFAMKTTVGAIGNSNGAVNYSWFDASPQMGNNFYRIKGFDQAGNFKYSTVVKVLFGKDAPGIVVYPNPIVGNSFTLDMNNLEKGMYNISLINKLGQEVFSEAVMHDGGSVMKTITMRQTIPQGTYQVVLKGENGMKLTQQVIKD